MDPLGYRMMAAIESHHWWWEGRRQILRETLTSLRERGALPIGTLYDFGCGCGANLSVLAEFGDAIGIDGSADAVAYGQANGRANVRLADLCDPEAVQGACPPGSGAAVLMADVLEHLDTERPVLETVRRTLVPEGRLIVTVPALPVLWGPSDEFNHHRRRYTRAGLARVVGEAFVIERMTYFNTALLVPIAVARWLARALGRPGHEEIKTPPRVLNAVFRRILGIEARLLRSVDLPIGVSLLCVARKVSG